MAKPTIIVEQSAESANGIADSRQDAERAALERRLQRLEDAVASLMDAKAADEQMVERLPEKKPVAAPELVTSVSSNPPLRSADAPRDTALSAVTNLASTALTSPLLHRPTNLAVFDFLSEARAIPRMFFDKQYQVSWGAKAVALVLVPLLLTSHWWLPFAGVVVVGPIFDKAVVLLFACVGYKVLSREAQRYLTIRASR